MIFLQIYVTIKYSNGSGGMVPVRESVVRLVIQGSREA